MTISVQGVISRAKGEPVEVTTVLVPEPGEYVALGAARQAAWALARTPEPPPWPSPPAATYTGPAQPEIRQRHAALRDDTSAWKEAAGT